MNAFLTLSETFDFKGIAHANLENKSMHVSKHLKPLLYFSRDCKSTKSPCHCSSIELTITLFRGYVLLAGLWTLYVGCFDSHSITCDFFSLGYFSLASLSKAVAPQTPFEGLY